METDPNWIQALLGNAYFSIATAIIALGSAISMAFPSKFGKDTWFGKGIQLVLDLANAAGLNFGKAKNADDA